MSRSYKLNLFNLTVLVLLCALDLLLCAPLNVGTTVGDQLQGALVTKITIDPAITGLPVFTDPTVPTTAATTAATTVSTTQSTTTTTTTDTTTSTTDTTTTTTVWTDTTAVATTLAPSTPPVVTASIDIPVSSTSTNVYVGVTATASGTAPAGVTASIGTIVELGGNQFQWSYTPTSAAESGTSVLFTAPDGYGNYVNSYLTLTVTAEPPMISFKFGQIKYDTKTNKASQKGAVTPQGVSITANFGDISRDANGKDITWTGKGPIPSEYLINGIQVFATLDGVTTSATFFVTGGSEEPNVNSLEYSVRTTNADLSDLKAAADKFERATSALLGLSISQIVSEVSSSSRLLVDSHDHDRRLAGSVAVAKVTIKFLPKALGAEYASKLDSSVSNGAYATELAKTSFSKSSGAVQWLNQPVLLDAAGGKIDLGVLNPLLALPLWALILIGIAVLAVIIITIVCCCRGCGACGGNSNGSRGRLNDNTFSQVAVSHPKSAKARGGPIARNFDSNAMDFGRPVQYETVHLNYDDQYIEPEPAPQVVVTDADTYGALASSAAEPSVVDVVSAPQKTIYLKVMPSGEHIPVDIQADESILDIKERVAAYLEQDVEKVQFLFNGRMIPNTASFEEFSDGTVVHVIVKISSKSSVVAPVVAAAPTVGVAELLSALVQRGNHDERVRRKARNTLAGINNPAQVNEMLKTLIEEESLVPQIILPNTSKSWLPYDASAPDASIFGLGAAQPYQRTDNFTLIGKIDKEDSDPFHNGLVQPLNYDGKSKSMEGVNSIVYQAVVGSKTVVIKGMLPFNNMDGYDQQFETQNAEYKIPLSMPPHANVIPILHQFVGSSALVYPWISEQVRDLSNEVLKTSGKRFIRRFTTYVVMEYYPSTLKTYVAEMKERGEKMTERELLSITEQLLMGVQHLYNHRVAHRDIKSDNVFRTNEGNLVLADFGCAISCGNLLYQRVDDLTALIGSNSSIAPEVHVAIKRGPTDTKEYVWDILKGNDVYAVGHMLYKMVGLKLPNNSQPYKNSDIPSLLASDFSRATNELLRGLVTYDVNDRLDPTKALKKIQLLLYGPSIDIAKSVDDVNSWLLERRLDLVFNVTASESSDVKVGFVKPNAVWPPAAYSMERKAVCRFLQGVEPDSLIRSKIYSDRTLNAGI